MALMKLEDIVQHEDVIAKKFSEEKLLKLIFLGILLKQHCNENLIYDENNL